MTKRQRLGLGLFILTGIAWAMFHLSEDITGMSTDWVTTGLAIVNALSLIAFVED